MFRARAYITAALLALTPLVFSKANGQTCSLVFSEKSSAISDLRQIPVRLFEGAQYSETLSAAIERKSIQTFAGFIEVEGIRVPRVSKNSKWRVTLKTLESDTVDQLGHLSGFDRKGDQVLNSEKAKYNQATGLVEYHFAEGKSVQVPAQEARALEYSYLDSVNPKSPRNGMVVGIHDDLAHIVKITRQATANNLGLENYYIRIDEISTEGLPLTSAENLYNKYNLHNPKYDPRGEWVSDRSIPANNIISTYKFRSVHEIKSLQKISPSLRLGDLVSYVAINGSKYRGKIARDFVVDGYVILSYQDKNGVLKYDIGSLDLIEK